MSIFNANFKERLALDGDLFFSEYVEENFLGSQIIQLSFKTPINKYASFFGLNFETMDGQAILRAFSPELINVEGTRIPYIRLNPNKAKTSLSELRVNTTFLTPPVNNIRILTEFSGDTKKVGSTYNPDDQVGILPANTVYRLEIQNLETTPIKVKMRVLYGEFNI
jgi:hypothetical protein